MSSKKKWLLLLVTILGVTVGYGAAAKAWPTPYHYGYFKNQHNASQSGDSVWRASGGPTKDSFNGFFGYVRDAFPNSDVGKNGCRGDGSLAIPMWVNTAQEFKDFVFCKSVWGNTQEHMGAMFIVGTMLGINNLSYLEDGNNFFAVWGGFFDRVDHASNQGWITWTYDAGFGSCPASALPNTYYNSTRNDEFAFNTNCGNPDMRMIIFNTPNGTYRLKRYCANPLGSMPSLPNFDMTGRSTATPSTVAPGQSITFDHYLKNQGPVSTGSTSINYIIRNTLSGNQTLSGNAGTFAVEERLVRSHVVNVPSDAVPGSQICRGIEWNPDTGSGGSQAGAPACATVQSNFTLMPSVNVSITGIDGPVTGSENIAELGDTATFVYAVNNTGTSDSQNVTCTYRQATYTGYSTAAPSSVFPPPVPKCAPSMTFPHHTNTILGSEQVVLNTPNQSVCRSLTVSPATPGGGSSPPAQACVHVASKPYFRVYGGDVMTGRGVETAPGICSSSSTPAVIGWNRRGGGNWAGAGVQFAIYALNRIYDVSSALSNLSGSATIAAKPQGLSFANTGADPNNGNFGGMFEWAACMPDYFVDLPDNLGATASAGLASGNYSRTGNLVLNGGTINPGDKVTIYVDGDLFIAGDIAYGGEGSWNSGNIPMFKVVVRGNIHISNAVTRLDGLYVAQPDGADGGIIYTCQAGSQFTPLSLTGSLASTCGNKLTVNGSFVARQVQLLRSTGTLRQSNPADDSGSPSMAEVFNYSPALWMSQPDSNTGAIQYDAITSLPPVL